MPFPYTFPFPFDPDTLRSNNYKIDTVLKELGLTTGFGVEVLIALISTRSKEVNIDAALKELSRSEAHGIDLAIQKPDFTSSHQIDTWLKATFPSEVSIDALLKGLSVSELYALDVMLQKLGVQSNYHNDVLLVLRNQVSHAISVIIAPNLHVPRFFSIGAYLISPQKFDLAVSFTQFMADPTFESFEAVSSFETLEVTPYFQEV